VIYQFKEVIVVVEKNFFKRLCTVPLEGIQQSDQWFFIKLLVLIESHIEGDIRLLICHIPNKAIKFDNKVNLTFLCILKHKLHDRLDTQAKTLRIPAKFFRKALPCIKSKCSLRIETLN
jgi:hypothetical protein